MKKSTSRIGDITEYSLAITLMDEGWEVFRNMGCDGPVDIIALNPETGETRFIDVKRMSIHESNGKRYFSSKYPKDLAVEIEYIGHRYETGETMSTEERDAQPTSPNLGGKTSMKPVSVKGVRYE